MQRRFIIVVCLILLPLYALATGIFSYTQEKQVPIDSALNLSLHIESDKQIIAHWQIQPGFMLYQKRIHIKTSNQSSTEIGDVYIPRNDAIKQIKIDGHPVFSFYANAYIPITHKNSGQLQLLIQYQGCKGKDYCYPPTAKLATINLNTGSIDIITTHANMVSPPTKDSHLFKQPFIITLLAFLGLGLLLSFTPCVLPMLPILWKIISGENHNFVSALLHGLVYILSMAICFAILGIIAASIGHSLQAILQNIWVIGLFCLIIIWLALSQFDLFRFRTPQTLDNLLQKISSNPKAGSYLAAITMGTLSSIVISPCVSAPLIAILLYIANTGNIALGGSSLFVLAIGMNLPLLAIALAGRKILPKAGNWMNISKHISGFVLLALAIWLLSRVMPAMVAMILYGILALTLAIYLMRLKPKRDAFKLLKYCFALLFFVYSILLFIGSAIGHDNPLKPLSYQQHPISMQTVSSLQQLNNVLAKAQQQQKPVIIDFYADWCVACQLMDKHVFSQDDVKKALAGFIRIRIDLSKNSPQALAIAKHYRVFAPPSQVFYTSGGKELKSLQLFGDTSKAQVLDHIRSTMST